MARFTDTDKWKEDWFIELKGEYQLFLGYIQENCDNAGIWKPNKIDFEIKTGFKVNLDSLIKKVNGDKERLKILPNGRMLIRGFIRYQFFTKKETFDLNLKNKFHNSMYQSLEANSVDLLLINGLDRIIVNENTIINIREIKGANMGANMGPCQPPKDKDKDIVVVGNTNLSNNTGEQNFQNPMEGFYSIETLKTNCLSEQGFVRTFFDIGIREEGLLEKWLIAFNKFLKFKDGKDLELIMRKPSEYRRHFGNWIKFPLSEKVHPDNYSPIGKLELNAADKPETATERFKRLSNGS